MFSSETWLEAATKVPDAMGAEGSYHLLRIYYMPGFVLSTIIRNQHLLTPIEHLLCAKHCSKCFT